MNEFICKKCSLALLLTLSTLTFMIGYWFGLNKNSKSEINEFKRDAMTHEDQDTNKDQNGWRWDSDDTSKHWK